MRAQAFEAACAENRALLGTVGDDAFRAGSVSPGGLERLLAVILPRWRPAARKPHKGCLVVATPRGGRRVPRQDLASFFAVQADTPDQRYVSGRTIQRVLQVIGAAHRAAHGDAAQIEAMLLALLEGGCLTPAGLLEKARKATAWGKVLGRTALSAKAKRARIRHQFRESLAEEEWPRAELEAFHAEVAAALARQGEVHRRVAPSAARSLRWAPDLRSRSEPGGTSEFVGLAGGVRTGTE
jgi:hypothetical protein